jgi:phosphohistidine phosphatase
MKTLYLIRHAKSAWKEENVADFDRPLSLRGTADAHLMGGLLGRRGAQADLIISSPAIRAAATALILAAELGYPAASIRLENWIYAESERWLEEIRALPDTAQSVLMVGHDPAISETAAALAGGALEPLPTAGVAVFECAGKNWKDFRPGRARLALLDRPRNHRESAGATEPGSGAAPAAREKKRPA